MRNFFAFIAILMATFHTHGQSKEITLEDIWVKGTFSAEGLAGYNSTKDGKFYIEMNGVEKNAMLVKYSYSTGKPVDTLIMANEINVDGKEFLPLGNYTLSNDEQKLLIKTEPEQIYRRSSKEYCYLVNLNTKKTSRVGESKILHCTFSPNSRHLAYMKDDNNLYIMDMETGIEKAITTDGKRNEVINGNCDWVYEEEFGFSQAFFWSKNGYNLAWYRFDESQVKEYQMPTYGKLYPELNTFKYPKAGEDNSDVSINVYNLVADRYKKIHTGSERDIYIPRIKWSEIEEELIVYRLNRWQNRLDLLLCNISIGQQQTIYTENSGSYVEINDDLQCSPDGESILFTSESDGFNHIYRLNVLNGKKEQLTKGNWEIDHIAGVNWAKKIIFYVSSEVSPMERHLYSIDLKGSNKKQLTKGAGWHTTTLTPDFSLFIDNYSTANSPPVISLRNLDYTLMRELKTNEKLKNTLKEYNLSKLEFIKVPTGNEFGYLNGWMIKPGNMEAGKQYPVLMYVYGGPGSQTVMDRWGGANFMWYQMLANKGYIIVSVDNTGTGFRGEVFKKKTYLQLGRLETADQITAAKYLSNYAYVDNKRIGIWGWSYGGYMSSLCATIGNETFKMAIAVAPVTNWRYYDNIYTERYMRRPSDNAQGYDENSPLTHVDKLKGPYLLIHGTADDNVHFQNSVMMVDALIKAGKKFDSEFYPNKNHSIGGGGTRLHLFRKMTDFIYQNL